MRTENKSIFDAIAKLQHMQCANPKSGICRNRFDKAALPMPITVLQRAGIKPGKANASGYWQVRCPFHKDGGEKNSSLSIHQVRGNFRCFACGAHGGDILDFWMKISGKGFKDAAKDLGAWKGDCE